MIMVYLGDPDYRHILFPNFVSYTGKLQPTKSLIYVKQKNEDLQKYLKEMQDLNLKGVYEIDMPSVAEYALDSPENIYDFMVSYFKFPDEEKTKLKFTNLMEEDKKEFIKLSKACGSWYTPLFRQSIRVYKLLEAMAMDKKHMLGVWYKLSHSYTVPRLWASFLTFSIKVNQCDSLGDNLPRWYRQTLERVNTRNVKFNLGLNVLKHVNLPYSVLIPRILLAMRDREEV